MTEEAPDEDTRTPAPARVVYGALLSLILVGAMVFLFVTLLGAAKSGRAAIEAYVADVRRGLEVSAEVGREEAAALTDLLRTGGPVSIANFQSQARTSCFWVSVDGVDETELRVVLREVGGGERVVAMSTRRRCVCPIDPDLPCALD